jgi:hypothetical protein
LNGGHGVGATSGFGVTMGGNAGVSDINLMELADGGNPLNSGDWTLSTYSLEEATSGWVFKHNSGLDFDGDGKLEVVLPYYGLNDILDTGGLDLDANRVFRIAEYDMDVPVFGCTDPEATKYNPDATIDDGSCEYDETNYSLSFDGCDWCDDYISMGDVLDMGDGSFTFETIFAA